jgi:hypothetical protein
VIYQHLRDILGIQLTREASLGVTLSNKDKAERNSVASRRRGPKPKKDRVVTALLQRWLDTNGFTSADLERAITAETGEVISRQNMTRIRAGQPVRQNTMSIIRRGAQRLSGRHVGIEELFDFDLVNTKS